MSSSEILFELMKQKGASVVGLGVSNLPLIKFLLDRGIKVYAHDRKDFRDLSADMQLLAERGVTFTCGEEYLDLLPGGVIFRSPGIRPDIPAFNDALAKGALLSSEIELFSDLCPTPVLGVTGSDGKTTTTTLSGLLLRASGRKVFVGGNIGEPPIGHLHEMQPDDLTVLELSSFQLMTNRRPADRAVITNITENHLNWHRDMAEYAKAKTNILSEDTFGVFNAENSYTADLAMTHRRCALFSSVSDREELRRRFGDAPTLLWSENDTIMLEEAGGSPREMLRIRDILLPGRHNLENYMAAIALTLPYITAEAITRVAKSFPGVAHRLEHIRRLEGVDYYNSSIDSTPSRTAAALSAMSVDPVVICGGCDKGVSFAPLARTLARRASAVVLTGATAEAIYSAILACPEFDLDRIPVERVPDFKEAVETARRLAKPGDAVLLSPACTSFDAFANFEERGNCFRKTVLEFK